MITFVLVDNSVILKFTLKLEDVNDKLQISKLHKKQGKSF